MLIIFGRNGPKVSEFHILDFTYWISHTCSRISKRNPNTWLFYCHTKKLQAHTPHDIVNFSLLDVCNFIHLLQIKSRVCMYQSGVLQCLPPLLKQHLFCLCLSSIAWNSLSQLWCGQSWYPEIVSSPLYGGKKKVIWHSLWDAGCYRFIMWAFLKTALSRLLMQKKYTSDS